MNILITGSSGFVGRTLVPCLSTKYSDVVTMDRSEIGDFTKISSWLPYLKDVDVVIHLAGRAHKMEDDPAISRELYFKQNVDVTTSLALDAQKSGVKKFIYVSSVKACGEGKVGPYRESDPCEPQNVYGESKLEAERELEKLSQDGEMNIVVIRPPLSYGPGVKANFRSLLNIAKKSIPLPFVGFTAQRSLVNVDNLNDFIKVVITKNLSKKFDIVFVSDGVDYTLPEMLSYMYKVYGVKNRLFYFPSILLKFILMIVGKREIYQRLNEELTVSCEKAMNDYGWKPPYSFEEGIRNINEKDI